MDTFDFIFYSFYCNRGNEQIQPLMIKKSKMRRLVNYFEMYVVFQAIRTVRLLKRMCLIEGVIKIKSFIML